MCDTLNNEIGRLADSLNLHHGGSTAAVATLLYVTDCLLSHYGRAHGADLTPLLTVQRRCADAYLISQGQSPAVVDAALNDLQRANGAVAYLASLPT